jgi:hypothetical protein
MKAKAGASIKVKHIVHWVDEASVLLIVLAAVVFADAFKKAIRGGDILWSDFSTSLPNLMVSSLIAIAVYGSMYTRPYSEKDKAPFIKRASAAVTQGFCWRLMFSD